MKKLIITLLLITLTITLFNCKSDDAAEVQESITTKNMRLINGNWDLTLWVRDGISQNIADCFTNIEYHYNSNDKTYIFKEYYVSNGNCQFGGDYNNTFNINNNTLLIHEENLDISYNIETLNETTLVISRNNETTTFNKIN